MLKSAVAKRIALVLDILHYTVVINFQFNVIGTLSRHVMAFQDLLTQEYYGWEAVTEFLVLVLML